MRPSLAIACIILLLMLLMTAFAWVELPDQSIAVHFSLDGTPNRYVDKGTALLQLPIAALFAILIFWLTPFVQSPERRAAEAPLLAFLTVGVPLLLGAGHALTIASALSRSKIDMSALAALIVIVLLAAIALVRRTPKRS